MCTPFIWGVEGKLSEYLLIRASAIELESLQSFRRHDGYNFL